MGFRLQLICIVLHSRGRHLTHHLFRHATVHANFESIVYIVIHGNQISEHSIIHRFMFFIEYKIKFSKQLTLIKINPSY